MARFGFILALFGAGTLFAAPAVNAGARAPILLELFTSEGCSSCPSADRLLEELDRTQPVPGAELIVLSEHVDYWDRLGWKDPFSSPQFSSRQGEYANWFHLEGVYTPQLVVDGKFQLVGSDHREALSAIDRSAHDPKIAITISQAVRSGDQVTVAIEVPRSSSQNPPVVLRVVLADDKAQSSVARGENAGRALTHVAVARALSQSEPLKLGAGLTKQVVLSVPPGAGANGSRIVVFLQDPRSGRVLGAVLRKL